MGDLFLEGDKKSTLVNWEKDEDALREFMRVKNSFAERSEVTEPDDMFFISLPQDMTRLALEDGLHVDLDDDPDRILIFNSDKEKLQAFLDKHNLKDVSVEQCDGDDVVKYRCHRLSPEDESEAMEAGLLVGRTDYTP